MIFQEGHKLKINLSATEQQCPKANKEKFKKIIFWHYFTEEQNTAFFGIVVEISRINQMTPLC